MRRFVPVALNRQSDILHQSIKNAMLPGEAPIAVQLFGKPDGRGRGRRGQVRRIKEIFAGPAVQADEGPVMLAGMIKAPGKPRARGGWLWVVGDLTSGSEQIVDWEFCVDCHANANEPHPYGDRNEGNEFRDYVFFPYRAL